MYENPTVDRLMEMQSAPFAHFSALGTWFPDPWTVCSSCGNDNQICIEPLLVQWEPSTDRIGDFSWDGPFGYVFIVQRRVVDLFQSNGMECDFLRVKYVPPESKRRRAKCVPYPYTGPELRWAECNTLLDLDMNASGVEVKMSCPVCGTIKYTFRKEGIVIRRNQWHGENLFRIRTNGRSAATFVTEEGRQLLQKAKCSNVAFSVAGEIR
jgi:hypothetical protein